MQVREPRAQTSLLPVPARRAAQRSNPRGETWREKGTAHHRHPRHRQESPRWFPTAEACTHGPRPVRVNAPFRSDGTMCRPAGGETGVEDHRQEIENQGLAAYYDLATTQPAKQCGRRLVQADQTDQRG